LENFQNISISIKLGVQFPFRFLFIILLFFVLFGGLVYRILDLSYFHRDYYKRFIHLTHGTKEMKKAIRGQIRDRRGGILAMTTLKIDVGVDPYFADVQKDREKIVQLAALLEESPEEIEQLFVRETFFQKGQERKLRWKKILTTEGDSYAKIKELGIKGIYGNGRIERIYPNNELACHLIGFLNREGMAVGGVEYFMDDFLRGQDGWMESEKDGKREEIPLFRKLVIDPKNGANVDLTIDMHLQSVAEELLQEKAKELQIKSGTIIVSDPSTGEILALCNVPAFDCNAYNRAEEDWRRNRAIADVYEPGSVFKIVAFSVALQERLISLQQRFDCTREVFYYNDRKYKLPKDHKAFGDLNAVEVLRQSSNRGLAQIGIILGAEKLYDAARKFGFGEKTGYGFDGEVSGLLPKPERWDSLTITRLPMGHAICATPLQVHQAMGVIASGGYLLEPKVIGRIVDENGEEIIRTQPHVVRQVLELDTVKKLREVLHNPEADAANIEGIKIAYKTGTTQKLIDGIYSHEHHIASCSGFFPAEEPRFLVTVVLDDPAVEGTAYGIRVAYPLFAKIARFLILSNGLNREIFSSARVF
jgi:cell division protein FtsI (penicillin-binding protein 3)/stage V sporulation protein D (sporulation-specific penicillin-binding protein)